MFANLFLTCTVQSCNNLWGIWKRWPLLLAIITQVLNSPCYHLPIPVPLSSWSPILYSSSSINTTLPSFTHFNCKTYELNKITRLLLNFTQTNAPFQVGPLWYLGSKKDWLVWLSLFHVIYRWFSSGGSKISTRELLSKLSSFSFQQRSHANYGGHPLPKKTSPTEHKKERQKWAAKAWLP